MSPILGVDNTMEWTWEGLPHAFCTTHFNLCPSCTDWLRAGWSGDRIPKGARFSAPVQTGPRAHPAPCTMGNGSFPGVDSGRGVTLTPHPLLVPKSIKQSRAIPLLSLRAFVACKKVETYLPTLLLHLTENCNNYPWNIRRQRKNIVTRATVHPWQRYFL
jgi:hypothetical protein